MQAIGFANKYFTLWNVDTYTRTIRVGQNEVVTRYTYIKNISFDKETAFSKYPNAQFIEDLRGKTQSWNSVKVVYTNVDTFRFGKYCNEYISDCADNGYLEWYWDNVYDTEHKEYVGSVLIGRGYEVRKGECNVYLMSPKALENERIEAERMQSLVTQLASGNAFDLPIDYNPNEEGYYRNDEAVYKFAEVKKNWYNGFLYYLPILKGKQKRVKGKTIIVKDYDYAEVDGCLVVNIKDFEVKK